MRLSSWRQRAWRLLLFDLDDTLLRSDKTVPPRALEALGRIRRERGVLVGVATSRSELNAEVFTRKLRPDVLITSGGARVRAGEKILFHAPFTREETGSIIKAARAVAGREVLMDADTPRAHYRNYPASEHKIPAGFEGCVDTDFSSPPEDALMVCVKLPDPALADGLRRETPFADVTRFVNSDWYRLIRRGVTKAVGMERLCQALCLSPSDIVAFGDDLADVEMLKLSGLGVAMGNAVPEVKAAADIVIGDNDSDAIADLLTDLFL